MSSWTTATVWHPDDVATMTADEWAARWPDVVRRLLGAPDWETTTAAWQRLPREDYGRAD